MSSSSVKFRASWSCGTALAVLRRKQAAEGNSDKTSFSPTSSTNKTSNLDGSRHPTRKTGRARVPWLNPVCCRRE
eukprot:764569-Hanusia_phi.AAC.2